MFHGISRGTWRRRNSRRCRCFEWWKAWRILTTVWTIFNCQLLVRTFLVTSVVLIIFALNLFIWWFRMSIIIFAWKNNFSDTFLGFLTTKRIYFSYIGGNLLLDLLLIFLLKLAVVLFSVFFWLIGILIKHNMLRLLLIILVMLKTFLSNLLYRNLSSL